MPNERLLLNSVSSEIYHSRRCGRTNISFHSKIIFIDLKKFEEIKCTREFYTDAKSIVLKDLILIQDEHEIYLYDINNLELKKEIELKGNYDYLYEYDNIDTVIGISLYQYHNDLILYKIDNNNLVKRCVVKTHLVFNPRSLDSYYEYNHKILYRLKDKRVILVSENIMYVLNLKLE